MPREKVPPSTPSSTTYRDIVITPETSEGAEALLLLQSANGSPLTGTSRVKLINEVTPRGQITSASAFYHQQTQFHRLPSKPVKRKLDLDSSPKKTRIDSSLSSLTKRFITLIPNNGESLDLNSAARSLQVQKRRIYDITNVLEGIGVLSKKSKNHIQWSDKLSPNGTVDSSSGLFYQKENQPKRVKLEREIAFLQRKEDEIDAWLKHLESSMMSITDDKRWAYVTNSDLKQIPDYVKSTLLLIKAPPNTILTVPPPEPNKAALQMHMKSTGGGEIGVYLVPEEDGRSSTQTQDKKCFNSPGGPTQGSSSSVTMKQSPQQLTPSPPLSPGFMELENDLISYNFTLGDDEGLGDLFDY